MPGDRFRKILRDRRARRAAWHEWLRNDFGGTTGVERFVAVHCAGPDDAVRASSALRYLDERYAVVLHGRGTTPWTADDVRFRVIVDQGALAADARIVPGDAERAPDLARRIEGLFPPDPPDSPDSPEPEQRRRDTGPASAATKDPRNQ